MKRRVVLRAPQAQDEAEFVAAARASRSLHRPWVSAPATPQKFQSYLERMQRPGNVTLLACRTDTGAIVGVFNITQIVMGPLRSAYLGYYAFAGHERQGLMREGLQLTLKHAFGKLKLHRIEANIQPGNRASKALAERCGFEREGFSPRYLKIGGRWCDHERWAALADEPAAKPPEASTASRRRAT